MKLEDVLNTIGISGTAQRVYLELIKNGSSSVRKVSENTNMPKTTVHDGLKILEKRGLVMQKLENGQKIFVLNDPEVISQALDDQVRMITATKKNFEIIAKDLKENTRVTEPRIRFFSGRKNIEKMLSDILWYENIDTYTMWPMKDMIQVVDMEYIEWHHKRRDEKNINLSAIRQHDDRNVDFSTYPYLAGTKKYHRILRYAPDWMEWSMSYWIYADKVTFISAGGESFGFTIQSKDFVTVMKAQWDAVWKLSKKS